MVRLGLLLAILPLGLVHAQQCQQLQDKLEAALLLDPDNISLQNAWQLAQHCDAITQVTAPRPAQSHAQRWQLSTGIDTNPTYSSSLNSFTLDSAGQSIQLTNQQKPQASEFYQLNGQMNQALGAGNLLLAGQYRWLAGQNQATDNLAKQTSQISALLDYQYPLAQQHQLTLGQRWLSANSVEFSQSQLGYWYMPNNSSQHWGLETRFRRLLSDPVLDGNTLLMKWRWLPTSANALVAYALGYDTPTGERAGDAYWLHEVSAAWQFVALQQQWLLQTYVRYQQDSQGYSALLANNAKRELTLAGLLLQWKGRATDWGQPSVQYELNEQFSNLSLFRWQGQILRLGWEWQW